MSLQDTPRGERVHIALFGRRNTGKSSLINALTGQQISIVSDIAGTTTDPVFKSMFQGITSVQAIRSSATCLPILR